MTNKEAIDIIKTAIADVEWNHPMDYAAAFEEAIKALRKQVPKKIARTKDNYRLPICPICGGSVQRKSYCCDCGQRLEWNE